MSWGPYGWLMIGGFLLTGFLWARAAQRDSRLPFIYFAALIGAMAGAKGVYLLAEGWNDLGRPDTWLRLATGKTILGGLLFGYPAVEWMKARLGYREPTGDRFAVLVPLGIGMGRVGCWLHGCCPGTRCTTAAWYTLNDPQGQPRWPAVPLELAFNALALLTLATLKRLGRFPGQLFHLYLIAYGSLRFLHEFVRDTPRVLGPISGYAIAALGVAALGTVGYLQRARTNRQPPSTTSPAPLAAPAPAPERKAP
jgi:phosphatidylglycerol:prolipoprotein diacylglycerol transferase